MFRNNLASGAVSFTTFATNIVTGSAEATYLTTNINAALLLEGVNVVAAEIHDANDTTRDISFDLELVASGSPENLPIELHALPMTNGVFSLWFNAFPGQGYAIESSRDLKSWSAIKTNNAASTRIDYIESNMAPASQFYRARPIR